MPNNNNVKENKGTMDVLKDIATTLGGRNISVGKFMKQI